MAYRTIAAVHALRITLRADRDFAELGPFLGEEEIATLASEINPSAAILHRLGRDIGTAFEKGWLDAHHATLLEQTVVQITDVVGACERIKNTPTPISYVLFIHRAVAIYCFLLPFGVLDTVKALTPVVVFFVSYALFSLDAIGDELDDPFRRTPNGLPLSTIARNIEIFVRTRLGEKDLPAKIQPVDGVVY
jgi:putative membrane protein